MDQIILYVDELNNDATLGGTSNPDTIKYNNNLLLAEEDKNDFTNRIIIDNSGAHVSAAGRYLCLTSVSIDTKKYSMIFFDLKENEAKAEMLCSKIDSQLQRDSIMQMFKHMRGNYYKKHYNEYKLSIGLPPK